MRILLLTPPEVLIRDGRRVKRASSVSAPLGIGYIAAALEKSGHEVAFIDSAAEQITNMRLMIDRVKEHNPDLIGISFMTINANQAFEVIAALKKQIGVPIMLGGPHPTYFPEDTLCRVPEADVIVLGEGEAVVVEVVKALFDKKNLTDIGGICYRDKDGKIIKNEPHKYIHELDLIPPPVRHIFNMSLYVPYAFQNKRKPVVTMITSRGCSYAKCTFCYSSVRKTIMAYRRHSVERVIQEIKSLIKDYGIKEINFLDDDFAAGRTWVNNFCEAIHREKIDLSWICMARSTSVSKELLVNMSQAGCWNIFFGIESANQHLLDNVKKGVTVEQNRKAVKLAHEAGMQVSAAFMMLLPGEVPEDARRNVQFAKELDIEFVAFGPTRPLAGTPLYNQCKASSNDEIPCEYYRKQGGYFIPYATFIPSGYTKEEALRVCRDAYKEYYLRPRYIWNMLRRINSLDDIKRYFLGLKLYLRLA